MKQFIFIALMCAVLAGCQKDIDGTKPKPKVDPYSPPNTLGQADKVRGVDSTHVTLGR